MTVNQASNIDQTSTNYPSFQPLKNFHNHFISCFTALPKNGKLLEVIKRICMICAAPFAYLVLAALALIGAPFCKSKIVRGSHSNESDASRQSTVTPISISEILDQTIKESKDQIDYSVKQIISNHRITKMKYLVFCTYGNESRKYEVSLSSDEHLTVEMLEESISRMHASLKAWILGLPGRELLLTKISGEAFCMGDSFHHANWLGELNLNAMNRSANGSHSSAQPDENYISDYLNLCLSELHCDLPVDAELPDSLFEARLLPDAVEMT